jgi:hypothetical protein
MSTSARHPRRGCRCDVESHDSVRLVGVIARLGSASRYNRSVVSWVRRLTSLTIVLALCGTPAALDVCAMLCFDGTPPASADMSASPAGHHSHAKPVATASVAAHDHHRIATSSLPGESASRPATSSSPHDSWDARVVGDSADCCADGQVAFALGAPAERSSAQVLAAMPAPAPTAFEHARSANVSLPGSPALPPLPTKACLVLRI